MAHTAQERYYHTPQGDVGQDLTIISAQYGFEVSHPARGRRIEGSNCSNSLPSARSHPARGRRIEAKIFCTWNACLNITPRKGTEESPQTCSGSSCYFNVTPRKGTENLPCQRVLSHHSVQDHTPQGDTGSCPALLHSFVRRSGAAAFLCNFGLFLIFSAIFPTAGVSAAFILEYGLFPTGNFPKKAVEISLFPAFFFAGSRAIMGTNLFKPVFRIFPCYFARRR